MVKKKQLKNVIYYFGGTLASALLGMISTKGVFLVAIIVLYCLVSNISLDWTIVALTCGVFVALLINICVVVGVQHRENPRGIDVSSKEMLKYGLPLALTTSMGFSIPLVEKLVIRQATSWDVLAVYTAASIFITVMNMVKTTVSNIWTPYAYREYQNEKKFKAAFFNVHIGFSQQLPKQQQRESA